MHLTHLQSHLDFLRELVIRLFGWFHGLACLALGLLLFFVVYAIRITNYLLMNPDHATRLCELEQVAIFEWHVGPGLDWFFVHESSMC